MKPVLKPPESKILKPRCDGPLSKLAFKFKLRRYSSGDVLPSKCLTSQIVLISPAYR